jgi:hypothetical protein
MLIKKAMPILPLPSGERVGGEGFMDKISIEVLVSKDTFLMVDLSGFFLLTFCGSVSVNKTFHSPNL